MATIEGKAVAHELKLTKYSIIPSGNVKVDKFKVELDDEWDDYTVRAVFYASTGSNRYEYDLDSNGECEIPATVLTNKCRCYVGLIGSAGDKTYTSTICVFDVPEGARAATATEVTAPDVYQQMRWLSYSLNNGSDDITLTVGSANDKYEYFLWTTGEANLTGYTTTNGVLNYNVYVSCKELNFTLANAKIFGLEPVSTTDNTYTWGNGTDLVRYNISVTWDGEAYVMFICSYEVE